MLTEDADDCVVEPGDVLATYEQIVEAVVYARAAEDVNRRLLAAATAILARSKRLKRVCGPEDLLQDAIEAVLDGRRKWCTNRVDFKGLLVGIMRSMVYSRDNTLAKKAPRITMEHELPLVGDTQEPLSLEEIAADPSTTESVVLQNEQQEIERGLMATLRSRYGSDDLHGRILDAVSNGVSTHVEIQAALGIEESVYRNAWKALMRAAKGLSSSVEES